MKPLISVIVPVYRVEEFLPRCVDSLRAQTYENLEIILVDDGSPDHCPEICEKYAARDVRIRVIHQENRGLSGARNAGIDAAAGEYLAFVDSDDYVTEDFIESLYTLAEETGCPIAQCRFSYVQGERLRERENQVWKIYRGESLMTQLYGPEEEATCFVVAWNKLYRKDLFDGIRYPEGRVHEDEATTYRLFHAGKKLAFLDRALYGYYTGNTGSITAVFSRKRLDWMTAHEERICFFADHRMLRRNNHISRAEQRIRTCGINGQCIAGSRFEVHFCTSRTADPVFLRNFHAVDVIDILKIIDQTLRILCDF